MDRFTYILQHVPGKDLHTADALSRAPLKSTENDRDLQQLAEILVAANISHLPAGKDRLEQYRQVQKTDPTCSTLRQYCCNGWPNKEALTLEIKPYWQERGNLTIGEDLLLHGSRVVIPAVLQQQTIQKLHQGHQGVQRCRLRANSAVWWPGISRQISDYISKCPQCCQVSTP